MTMIPGRFGAAVRGAYRHHLAARAAALPEPPLGERAVVFAPHFDDETLGCGGTIARKRRAGADVHIVWMTDGAFSHRELMVPAELAARRAGEGRAAAATLGVPPHHLVMLDFPEGELRRHEAAATIRCTAILRDVRPSEIYVPHRHDPQVDHQATYRAVRAAVAAASLGAVTIYEYPVWMWAHWPNLAVRDPRLAWVRAAGGGMGSAWRLLTEFTRAVRVSDVLESKRAALGEHHTQMTRVRDDDRWATLPDVAAGEFLASFFDGFERFKRTLVRAES